MVLAALAEGAVTVDTSRSCPDKKVGCETRMCDCSLSGRTIRAPNDTQERGATGP